METNDLIATLRDWAEVEGAGTLSAILNEAADKIEALDERVAIMSEPHGWISVSDKLPEEGQEVVIHIGDDNELVRFWNYRWVGQEEWFILDLPTHWMPLPEPPKEGEVG